MLAGVGITASSSSRRPQTSLAWSLGGLRVPENSKREQAPVRPFALARLAEASRLAKARALGGACPGWVRGSPVCV